MSNAELIEVMRYNFGRQFVPPKVLHEAADALAAADRRIAELEAKDMRFSRREPTALRYQLDEAERKLAVAREALSAMWLHYKKLVDSGDAGNWTPEDEPVCKQAIEALAQIGGEDASN